MKNKGTFNRLYLQISAIFLLVLMLFAAITLLISVNASRDYSIEVNQELNRTELFDIEADWGETTNMARANPDVVEVLTKKALEWKRSLPTEPPANCFSRLRTERQ